MDSKILAIIVIGIVVIAGIGYMMYSSSSDEVTAEEIRDKSVEAMVKVDTYAFDMNVGMLMKMNESGFMGINNMEMEIDGKSKVDTKNKKMYMEMDIDMMGMSMGTEIYFIEDMQYMQFFGMWMKNETTDDIWDKQNYANQQADLMKSAKVELLDSEEVDGVDCYVLKVTPDVEKMFEMASQVGGTSTMPDDMLENISDTIKSMELKQWIAKDSYLITKTVMGMQTESEGTSMDMNMTMKMYDYNKPMDIVLPEEAKDAMDMNSMIPEIPEPEM